MHLLPSPAWVLTLFITTSVGQILINGQIYTNGLSIIDSPALNTPFSVGSTLPIAVDVSGDGQLASAAETPGSNLPTRFDLLEIYLVSSETDLNITVASGPGLLTNEQGTVRHLSWTIPSCVTKGNYNLTFYETSHINGQAYFSITPIPITINNNEGSSCPDSVEINTLQTQPQSSSPVSQSPFLPSTTLVYVSTVTSTTTRNGQPTVTTCKPNHGEIQ
ncbi:hypothetical protein H0H93_002832 [Arthromyces matolae]|nr:hypothetical protein H0H93_002832 [Arthromyces matolae]